MSATTDPLNESGAPVSGPIVLAEVKRFPSLVRTLLAQVVAHRRERSWLALVVAPLGIVAATVSLQFWWDVPLAVAVWWWGPTDEPYVWLLGILEGCFGVQWAFIGATCLAAFPEHRLLVGMLWIGYAGGVAAIGLVNRQRFSRRYGW